MRSLYGKKGGTSVNAGRRSVWYEITLPDGRTVQKKSFTVDHPEGVVGYIPADENGDEMLSHVHVEVDAAVASFPFHLRAVRVTNTHRPIPIIRQELADAEDAIRAAVRDVDAAMEEHHAAVVFGMLNDRVRAAEATHAELMAELRDTARVLGYVR